jgi:hypothetical protein
VEPVIERSNIHNITSIVSFVCRFLFGGTRARMDSGQTD